MADYKSREYKANVYKADVYKPDIYSAEIYKADVYELLRQEDKCDKYDYLIAVGCGAIGGIIDIFFVNNSGSSLEKWTDEQTDKAVKKFAKLVGWEGKNDNIASAIGYLEKKFKVNYDQRYTPDVNGLFQMNTKNHHMMSLGHSPDIIGLFFSVLNQFTSTSSFIANGELITIRTDTYELYGENFVAKLYCGITNWLGHIMSDIAGSSGSKGNQGRGTGIVAPFYELFQFCKFGKLQVGKNRQDLATIAIRAFQEGYDFRHCVTATMPLLVTELSIKLIWALRRKFQYGYSIKNCIPTNTHADLRVMILVGDGVLCVFDGVDAYVRSNGDFLMFFMRINLVSWFQLVRLALKEVCIRANITKELQKNIPAYSKIDVASSYYLDELKRKDRDLFEQQKNVDTRIVALSNNAENTTEIGYVIQEMIETDSRLVQI